MPTNRQEFNSCVQGGLKDKHFPDQAARRMEFCVLAKMCAKHLSRDEAEKICSQPKPPKPEGEKKHRRSKKGECPPFDTMSLMPHCEKKLAVMVKSGELPTDTDVPGICQLILG